MLITDVEKIMELVCPEAKIPYHGGYTGIGLHEDGYIKSGFLFENFNGVNIEGHVAGEKFTRKMLRFAFGYCFNQLNAKRITVKISAENKKSLRFVKRLGFEHEATLKDFWPEGDVMIFRMFKQDCKWIGG